MIHVVTLRSRLRLTLPSSLCAAKVTQGGHLHSQSPDGGKHESVHKGEFYGPFLEVTHITSHFSLAGAVDRSHPMVRKAGAQGEEESTDSGEYLMSLSR